jgi:hypothetical protein
MYSLLKALFYYYIGPGSIPLGDYIYILDNRVVKGPLIKWDYILSQ